jgi:hypothetical protein
MTITYTKERGERILHEVNDHSSLHPVLLVRFFGGDLSHLTEGILDGKIVEYCNSTVDWVSSGTFKFNYHKIQGNRFRIKPEATVESTLRKRIADLESKAEADAKTMQELRREAEIAIDLSSLERTTLNEIRRVVGYDGVVWGQRCNSGVVVWQVRAAIAGMLNMKVKGGLTPPH